MNNNYSKILAAVAVLSLFALVPFSGTAQTGTAPYGTKVAFGDNDFVPTLAALAGPAYCRVPLGDTSLVTDDGNYLIPAAGAAAATLPVNSVRLTSVLGKAAGTVVGDSDTSEKGQACVDPDAGGALVAGSTTIGFAAPAVGAINVFALSFDAIAAYSSGDCVYLDSGMSGVLGAVSRWDIRLTGCTVGSATYAAGSVIELGDMDLVNAPAPIVGPGEDRFWDSGPNGVFDGSDRLYLTGAGATSPGLNAVRVLGGAFGSKVGIGGGDFLVATAVWPAGPSFCQLALGDTSLVTDNGYYLMPVAAATATVAVNSIRLTPVAGKAAGTLVSDADTSEKGQTCVAVSTAVGFAVAAATNIWGLSFDQVAGYTSGDCAYVDRDATGTFTRWDIRLTECKVGSATYVAGSLVELGDMDLVNSPGPVVLSAAASFGFFDSQPNGVVDSNDRAYVNLLAQPTNPGTNDVRLIGGTFGKKVTIGDDDFIPTLTALPGGAGLNFCRVALGDTSLVTDDGFYAVPGAAATATVLVNSVRLVTVGGKAAGTLVGDADTSEKGQACADPDAGGLADGSDVIGFAVPAAAVANVFALSFDQVAAYTGGDCVYLDSAASGVFGAFSRWDIRLTVCKVGSTTYNAGTLVELGDADLVNAPAAIAGPLGARFWDSQPNGVFDGSDRMYLTGVALAVRPGLNDVRIIGTFAGSCPPGGCPPDVTPGSSTTTTTSSSVVTPTTCPAGQTGTPPNCVTPTTCPAGQTGTPPNCVTPSTTTTTTTTSGGPGGNNGNNGNNGSSSSSTSTTPGIELVALVGALAVALVLVRRKL